MPARKKCWKRSVEARGRFQCEPHHWAKNTRSHFNFHFRAWTTLLFLPSNWAINFMPTNAAGIKEAKRYRRQKGKITRARGTSLDRPALCQFGPCSLVPHGVPAGVFFNAGKKVEALPISGQWLTCWCQKQDDGCIIMTRGLTSNLGRDQGRCKTRLSNGA